METQERLEKQIGVRLTQEEWQELTRHAGGPGKVSAYLRGLVRGAHGRYTPESEGQRERQTA